MPNARLFKNVANSKWRSNAYDTSEEAFYCQNANCSRRGKELNVEEAHLLVIEDMGKVRYCRECFTEVTGKSPVDDTVPNLELIKKTLRPLNLRPVTDGVWEAHPLDHIYTGYVLDSKNYVSCVSISPNGVYKVRDYKSWWDTSRTI